MKSIKHWHAQVRHPKKYSAFLPTAPFSRKPELEAGAGPDFLGCHQGVAEGVCEVVVADMIDPLDYAALVIFFEKEEEGAQVLYERGHEVEFVEIWQGYLLVADGAHHRF